MVEYSNKQLKWLLRVFRTAKKSVMITGPTGVGKSQNVKEESVDYAQAVVKREFLEWNKINEDEKVELLMNEEKRRKSHIFIDTRISIKDPTDFQGMPSLINKQFMEWIPPLAFKILGQPGVSATVFFDEFNQAAKMVQNSSFSIVLDKFVGLITFQPDVHVVAAGNDVEDGGHVIEMSAPLKNRFAWIRYLPKVEEWEDYTANYPNMDFDIRGVIHQYPDMLHGFKANTKSKAFTSPRALCECSDVLFKNKDIISNMDQVFDITASMCGDAFAAKLVAFKKHKEKLKIDEILKNPSKIESIKEVDVKHALMSALAAKYREVPKLMPEIIAVCEYLDKEFGVYLLKTMKHLAKSRDGFVTDICKIPIWNKKLSKDYGNVLSA